MNVVENDSIKLIATDLDGTLLDDSKEISSEDFKTLEKLGEMGIVRVVATGRSLHKVREVLSPSAPFDYIVFSSGSGIFDWQRQILLKSYSFESHVLQKIVDLLKEENHDFFVFKPIPFNNEFSFFRTENENAEFDDYLDKHKGGYAPFDLYNSINSSGQVMAILPNKKEVFESLKSKLIESIETLRVIRTTSPISGDSIWTEIFPEGVSKGDGILWLCGYLNIDREKSCGIGNDYNDSEMFEVVGHPYLVGNAPEPLCNMYPKVSATNNQSGFTACVEKLFNPLS